MSASLILIVLAFIFALLAAFRAPSPPPIDWGWLGVTFWFASMLVGLVRL